MATGTATINFGSTPANQATALVSGLSGLSVGTFKEAWFEDDDSTTDNPSGNHKMMRIFARVGCEYVSATSMNINVDLIDGMTIGTFSARYATL
jgi:hypothetical protein